MLYGSPITVCVGGELTLENPSTFCGVSPTSNWVRCGRPRLIVVGLRLSMQGTAESNGSSPVTGSPSKNTRTPKSKIRKPPATGRKTFHPISIN